MSLLKVRKQVKPQIKLDLLDYLWSSTQDLSAGREHSHPRSCGTCWSWTGRKGDLWSNSDSKYSKHPLKIISFFKMKGALQNVSLFLQPKFSKVLWWKHLTEEEKRNQLLAKTSFLQQFSAFLPWQMGSGEWGFNSEEQFHNMYFCKI